MASLSDRREIKLLWRLLSLGPGRWQRPAPLESLPGPVHHFLYEADLAGLERLLIETVRRIERVECRDGDGPGASGESMDNLTDPLALHRLIQDELRSRSESA